MEYAVLTSLQRLEKTPRRRRLLGLAAILLALTAPHGAAATIRGDVNQDCSIDSGDALLLTRALAGSVSLTPAQQKGADVAPVVGGVVSPDGLVTPGDLVVLLRALGGLLALPSGANEPTINVPTPANTNPITVTGTACPGDTVTLYVGPPGATGLPRATTVAVNGAYSFTLVGIGYGDNEISTRAAAGGVPSNLSNVITVANANIDLITNPPPNVTSGIVVWPPRVDGNPYHVSTDVTISSGATLILPPGTRVQFDANKRLSVAGKLLVQGAATSMVTFERSGAFNWKGIVLTAGQASVIEYALIDNASTGLEISGASTAATLRNSEIRTSSLRGINVSGGAQATIISTWVNGVTSNPGINLVGVGAATLTGNTVTGTSTGIWIDDSSPNVLAPSVVLRGNSLHNNGIGLRIEGNSSPHVIEGNLVFSNATGVYVRTGPGDLPPNPIVSGNAIYANPTPPGTRNLVLDPAGTPFTNTKTTMLDATRNWWGDTNPQTIAAGIDDYSEWNNPVNGNLAPIVDFVPFLDSPGGNEVPSTQYLVGLVSGDLSALPGGMAYQAVGSLIVKPGSSWTLHEGVKIEFPANAQFDVFGALQILGTVSNLVTLRRLNGQASAWPGIDVEGSGTSALVDYVLIEAASTALDATSGAELTVSNSQLRLYTATGISFGPGTQGTITDNQLEDDGQKRNGISINGSSPLISGNTIHLHANGIAVTGASMPVIGPGNVISDFRDAGIDLNGPASGVIIGNTIDGGSARGRFGIDLDAASPLVQGNTIHNTETAIHVRGNSAPVINAANNLYGNIWGIWLEGTPVANGNPNPVINRNNLYNNSGASPALPTRTYCATQGANLCVSGFSLGSVVLINARENWWGTNNSADVRASVLLPATNPVPVDLSDFLLGVNGQVSTTGLFSFLLTGISHSPDLIAPTLGGVLNIAFTTVAPADVTVRIYEEDHDSEFGNPVLALRTITQSLGAGAHSIPWDGKNNAGQFVPDEAYIYVLSATASGFVDTFNPPRGTYTASAMTRVPPTQPPWPYNLYRNEPLKILFDLDDFRGRIKITRTPKNDSNQLLPPPVTLVDSAPFPRLLSQLFVYDGFDPSGNFLEGLYSRGFVNFNAPTEIKPNAVIVERTTPQIAGPSYVSFRQSYSGTGAKPPLLMCGPIPCIPKIEVKADPYLIRYSYDQLTRIAFCIDQAAYLTVKILVPGRGNPDAPSEVVATLVNDTTVPHAALNCAGGALPYVVEWDGLEPGNPDPYVTRPNVDGSYTFTIEARNALQPSLRSVYRGIVQGRQ